MYCMLTCVYSFFVPQANIGQMDTAKDMWKMIMGNLALIQVSYAGAQLLFDTTLEVWISSGQLRNKSVVVTGSEKKVV